MSFPLASFKLQIAERRIRVVPQRGLDGCAFAGPGVDIVGDACASFFALGAPVFDWLLAREPGVAIRSLSMDLQRGRVLVTYAPMDAPASARPHVLRVDAPLSSELVDLAQALCVALGDAARARLAARA